MDKCRCIICGKEEVLNEGVNGIIIRGKLVCRPCIDKVMVCELDSDFYQFYKNKLKEEVYKKKTV